MTMAGVALWGITRNGAQTIPDSQEEPRKEMYDVTDGCGSAAASLESTHTQDSFFSDFWGPQFFLWMAADLVRASMSFTWISSQEPEWQLTL